MSIFNKIKKGIEHAVSEGAGEVKKVINGINGAQKDMIATVQKEAKKIIDAAYEAQKNILADTQKEAESMINKAYEEQKKIIKEAQDKAITVGTSELYDIIIKVFDNGNLVMKIIAMILKSFKTKILKEITDGLN